MKNLSTSGNKIIGFTCLTLTLFILTLSSCQQTSSDQSVKEIWHDQTRKIRYQPKGNGFEITNGKLRFNRALYGSNTAFRVEAGDLPEFALYMPRIGGTLRLGLVQADSSKWLIDAEKITAYYEAGTMIYKVTDPLLGKGTLNLQLLALPDADGMVLNIKSEDISENIELIFAFGGASNKRLSRDGDLGADPESSFYLKAESCKGNNYYIDNNSFRLYYGSGRSLTDNEVYENNYQPSKEELESTELKEKKRLFGLFPEGTDIFISDASDLKNPHRFLTAQKNDAPAIAGKLKLTSGEENFLLLVNPDTKLNTRHEELPQLFHETDSARKQLAQRIKIETPDEYINCVGASIATAADAVWDGQSFMHGAIAWRMPLNGWRGAYAADWLGWHDRAKTHFRGYFESQYTDPSSGPSVPDPKTHFARQKEEKGTALFTDGYISRRPGGLNKPHHYDMNLVFISQLLSHFHWTGDLDFLRESWPVLEKHLAWEKRNFDANDDGLYDAYASIWASDALQYSGGGVTHSSAYNYRANKMAAELAQLVGEDPGPYFAEAVKIKNAVNNNLWLSNKGWFAEYKDLLGNQLVHPSAAIWTVYHAIDEGLADPFQAYQATQYVDHSIPHIPIEADGLPEGKHYTLSTTDWMPYTWSINNVAFAEVLHTALAYWQSGRSEKAFELSKGVFLDYMFLGSSPGNFGQLSFYDAFRGELYRDFSDPVGMASRALIEGMFGVSPNLINKKLTIKPGWPSEWEHTKLETPDIKLHFQKKGNIDQYKIESNFKEKLKLNLILKAKSDKVRSVKVNGTSSNWKVLENAIGLPELQLISEKGTDFSIEIEWGDSEIEQPQVQSFYAKADPVSFQFNEASIIDIYDPQKVLDSVEKNTNGFQAIIQGELGWRTIFIQLKQNEMVWWQPLSFEVRKPIEIISPEKQSENDLVFTVQNNKTSDATAKLKVNNYEQEIHISAQNISDTINIPAANLVPGSNYIQFETNSQVFKETIQNWNIQSETNAKFEKIYLIGKHNDKVTHIFKEQYLSPRSPYPTLSIPIQGIGDWCSYRETEKIDDSGLRKKARKNNEILSPQGIPFQTPGDESKNVLFTSKWDNYPDSVHIPLSGNASHLYLLMAGSAHHMQMNMTNGTVQVKYTDGTFSELPLISPDNWWPIEQDYYEDGYAFKVNAPQPPRLYLHTGEWHLNSYDILKKNGTNRIEGGAASMLDLPLNENKELSSLQLITHTNDVVIGIMAATLKRK